MTLTHVDTPAAILEELAVLPHDERCRRVEQAGDIDDLLVKLGDEAEKLVVVEVSRARSAAELVMRLADEIGSSTPRARARRALVQALAYAGEFDEALARGREAIAVAEGGGSHVEAARARLASIHAMSELGRYDEAIESACEAHRILTREGRPELAARADLNLGVVYRKANDPALAVEHFQRARPALAGEPIILAQLASNHGEALLDLDRLDESREAFAEALDMFEQTGHDWGAAIVEGNLADLATRQGRFDRALYHFEGARRHLEHDASPTHLARILVEQGDAKSMLGMLDDALRDYREALPTLQEHHQPADSGRALAGLARALLRMGRLEEAETALGEAFEVHRTLGHAAALARLSLLRSDLAVARGDLGEAMDAAEYALAALEDRPIDAAIAHYRLADLACTEGDLSRARRWLDPARATAEQSRIAPLLADVLHLSGRIDLKENRPAAAIEQFREAVRQVERTRGMLQADRFRAAYLGGRLGMYESLVAALIDTNEPAERREAFLAAELAKSRSLADVLRGAVDPVRTRPDRSASVDKDEADLLDELSHVQGRLNNRYRSFDASDHAEWRSEVESLEEKLASLESRLAARRQTGVAVAELYAAPASVETVQRSLAADEVLIEYFAAEGALIAFVVTPEEDDVVRCSIDIDRARELVRQLHFQIGRALRPGGLSDARAARLERDVRRPLRALYEALVEPLAHRLAEATRVVIVPHDLLHLIPFAALDDGDRYLIETLEVVHAPSATVFAHLQSRDGMERSASVNALVVGVADENAPQVLDEARAAAELLHAGATLIDDSATSDAVVAAMQSAGIIHLACHGRFLATNPLGSGLRLHDCWLTVRDIYRMRLPGSFVALSGCETGVSQISSGDELTGLVRAFLAAGASSLAVSLWSVRDEQTTELMLDFYRELQACGQPSAAMRLAQIKMLCKHRHPVVWAPFVIMGRTSS